MQDATIPDHGPILTVNVDILKGLRNPLDAVPRFAARLIEALRAPPHFVRLQGLPGTEDRRMGDALARQIAATPPLPPEIDPEKLRKVSFTQVRIDKARAENAGSVTAYSRTNQPLALHTDSSYLRTPHPLVMFQFVRVAAGGGASVMASLPDVMQRLSSNEITALATPQFDFGKGPLPILFGRQSAPYIRYYRSQIDTAAEQGAPLTDTARAAMDRLDDILANEVRTYDFHANPGDIVFMHNLKVLHGRRGFAGDSDRLMYRYRMHCGCLG